MKTSGPGLFFDGVTSARQEVTVELAPAAVQIRTDAGELVAEWPYAEIGIFSAPEGVMRLGRAKSPVPARLELRDRELAVAFNARAGAVKRVGAVDRRTSTKVVAWSLAAVVSAVLVAVFGVPAMVERVTPLVPIKIEQRLGASVDSQVRALLDHGSHDRFECAAQPGRAAFDKLVRQLETAGALPLPVHAVVVRRSEANAIALPGGRIYVFEGLVDKADTADELAGVIAHEMGHIAHRDGVRAVIQAAGLSFMFGMLIGDFSGGGAAVLAMRTVLQSSYSRDTEAAADAYGAGLIAKLGRDPRALGTILIRIAGTPGPMSKILLDHPEAQDRAAAINAIAAPKPRSGTFADGTGGVAGLVDAAEWAALKKICGGSPQAGTRGR
jgi:Zn-dependent protease with chaperone function